MLGGMNKLRSRRLVEDWRVLQRFLPAGWRAAAWRLGALQRARRIRGPAMLLRALLVHLAAGCSLQETAARLRESGVCAISSVSLFHRLQAAERWLGWLARQLWRGPVWPASAARVRAVDGTLVREAGRTGSTYRVHFSLELTTFQCDFFELTDDRGGETLRRYPVQRGDVVLADRVYGTPPGVRHVIERGGQVVVRINLKRLPLYSARGRRLSILAKLRRLRRGQTREWPACVQGADGLIPGRLVAVRRGRQATLRAQRRLKKKAHKQQHTLSPQALEAAGFVFVWTSLPARVHDSAAILELYRARWLVEIAFKRMKSLLGLGQLPKRADASSRAWLHGKLLVALLIERLIQTAQTLSPWGYPLAPTPQPLASDAVHVP